MAAPFPRSRLVPVGHRPPQPSDDCFHHDSFFPRSCDPEDAAQTWQSLPFPDISTRRLGTITEIAGLYILLAAGTRLLPEKIRIANYKLWMRSTLILWWVVLLLGFATYARWYVPHFFRR